MSHCVEKLPHSCGSSDGLQVFEEDGKYTGYCFKCSTYVPDPYKDKGVSYKPKVFKKTKEQIDKEIAEIRSYQFLDIPSRKLKKEYLEYFGIRVGVKESDGVTPETEYFPAVKDNKLAGYKVRLLTEKKMWGVGSLIDLDLFGWFKASKSGAKRLYITEGENDAVALYQALKENQKGTQYESNPIAVVSLPSGAGSASKSVGKHLEQIKRLFKEVVLVFDQDEAGEEAVKEVLKLIPDALTASLPEKDPNDCVIKGFNKALVNAVLFQAKKPKNTRLIWGDVLADKAREETKYGVSYPWEGLTKLTRGIRTGETIYFGAGVNFLASFSRKAV